MVFLTKLKTIERLFPWSFLGVGLGVLSIILAIIIFVLAETKRRPDFKVKVNSVEKLVEVREQIEHLKIFYMDKDIFDANEELMILNLTLVNEGSHILQQMYDQQEPFGLNFPNASVISFKLFSWSSEYIKENLRARVKGQGKEVLGVESRSQQSHLPESPCLIFSKLIFERGAYARLKVYLLHERGKPCSIVPMGKIAGIKKIPVLMPARDERRDWALTYIAATLAVFGSLTTVVGLQIVAKKHKYLEIRQELSQRDQELISLLSHQVRQPSIVEEKIKQDVETIAKKLQEMLSRQKKLDAKAKNELKKKHKKRDRNTP